MDLRSQLRVARDKLFPRPMCGKKVRYETRRDAARVMSKRQKHEPAQLYVYRCKGANCGGAWHITKMKPAE
jgi:hypothetical protein